MNCCATVLLRYYGNATGCIGHVTKENPICHNINIIGIGQKLICPIQFQSFQVFLDPPNGILQSKVENQ
jgi:hypothetical protein